MVRNVVTPLSTAGTTPQHFIPGSRSLKSTKEKTGYERQASQATLYLKRQSFSQWFGSGKVAVDL